MTSSALKVIVGILVAVLLIGVAGAAFVWWKIVGLKEKLVTDLGHAIGAQVQVSSIDLDFWKGELHAAGISLTNDRPTAPWQKGDISQVTVHFHLSDILASTLPLNVEVSSWNLILAPPVSSSPATGGTADASVGSNLPNAGPSAPPGKERVRVTQLAAQDGSVEIHLPDGRKVVVRGVEFEGSDNGAGVWTTSVKASSIDAGIQQTGPCSVQLRSDAEQVTFSDLRMQCQQGFLTGDGTVDIAGAHTIDAKLKITQMPVTTFVAVAWQMALSGMVDGDIHYKGDDLGGEASGQVVVSHAKINVLPWLGKVTALVGLQDISNVELDKATTDFEWRDHTLHLTNLDVRKNDVVRIGGGVDVDPTGQLDGRLKLGLPAVVITKWPQLQTQVFPVQTDDYCWADVHLTGPPDHLQEDLSSRVLAVGLNQGSDLLNQAAQKASDLYKNFMGK